VAARVTVDQVKEIIETSIPDAVITSSMIETATLYVDEHLLELGYTDAMLERIELYLAAHFVAITEEQGAMKFDKLGDASSAWETSFFEVGLKSTRFGQTALTLDSSGTLANVGSASFKAEFRVV
jgi:hypothetical protein